MEMAEIATKHQRGIMPTARLASVADRTSGLSDEVLKSLKTGERTAIETVGQLLITSEEALSEEVAGTSEVANVERRLSSASGHRSPSLRFGISLRSR